MTRALVASCLAVAGMAIAAGASAQSAQSSSVADAAGTRGSAASGGLEEVTVTAQRREENLQKTPLAVVAISGE